MFQNLKTQIIITSLHKYNKLCFKCLTITLILLVSYYNSGL